MAHSSVALTTLADVLVIGSLAFGIASFFKYKQTNKSNDNWIDYVLIAIGAGSISLFYISDLIVTHVVPNALSSLDGHVLMDQVHEIFEWIVVPLGFVAIVVGFTRCVLHHAELQRQLIENEADLSSARSKAETALDKLKQREAELNEKNASFSLALQNMSQGLCVFDKDMTLVVSNEKYAELYGLDPKRFTSGIHFRDILQMRVENEVIMGRDPEKYIEERLESVKMSKDSTTIQRLSDGRVVVIVHRPLADGGWVATHEDITELAKAESMNQRLARIVENAVNEIYVFDAETLKFAQVNESACENLGYSPEELNDMTPLDIEPSFTPETFEAAIAPLRSGEKDHVRYECVHRRKDGSDYEVRVALQLIESQNEQVFAAIVEDVTEAKIAERDLKRGQEMFSKAFHANPIPFSISMPEGAIYDVNDAWLRTLGYTREEAIGNSALKLGVWADPAARAHFVELLKESSIVENYEAQYRTKDGELRDMLISGEWVTIRGEDRMFNISHDVTERKATERQLMKDRDTLQQLVDKATAGLSDKAKELEAALGREKKTNEIQRQFISMASHEFRTPLAIIDSTAQRLKKNLGKETPDTVLRRIEKIRDSVERMTRLMESTLTAARLDEGQIGLELDECNVKKIVEDICEQHQEIAPTHKISLTTQNLPKTIVADAGAFDQILSNLLSNAVKYSPDSPQIDVRAFGQGTDVVLEVSDHGIGIDKRDIPNMFSRFFRAKTAEGIAGTGIGLNLVKKLVELHDGTVSVESTKGKGSVFTLKLPVAGPATSVKVA